MTWQRHPVKHLAAVSVSNVDKKSAEGEIPVRLVNYTDVYYGDRLNESGSLMEATATPSQVRAFGLRRGDVVLTKDSETADDIGVAAYVESAADDVVLGYHLALLRPRGSFLDGRFLYWAMSSDDVRGQLASGATGVTRFGLRGDVIGTVRLAVPSLAPQRAIAEFLDAETARIDALTAKKCRMIDVLEERWRNEVRLEMRSLAGENGSIALKRLVVCLDGRRVPLSAEERAGRQGEYPYFGASGQIDTVDDYLFDETLVLLGEDGAQLADPNCEISTVVSGRVWVNNHAHVLRAMAADPWFLALHLSSVDRGLVISGATREKITQADMNEIPVPDVPVEAQLQISTDLRARRSQLDELSDRLQSQIALLQEHRQALITAAVAGELDIPGVAA